MIKKFMKKYSVLAITALLAIVLVLSFHFSLKDFPPAVRTTNLSGTENTSVTAVSISDLGDLNTLEQVNFTPDKFLVPQSEIGGEIITLGTNSPDKRAGRGTYEFVILNLDPSDAEFEEKSKALNPYLFADNYWHFTLYIPASFSACAVYINTVLEQQSGVISDYNLSDYCDYQGEVIEPTVYHKTQSEPLFIDLRFYSKREALPSGMPLKSARTITIHFEGEEGKISGLMGVPLIGSDSAVRNAVEMDNSILTIAVVIAGISLAVFIFLCFLKRTLSFLPQLFIVLGVFGVLSSAIILTSTTTMPYLWAAVGAFSSLFVLFSAILSLRVKIGKIPIWLPFAAFAFVNCVLAFVAPLCSLALYSAFAIYIKTTSAVTAFAVVFLIGFYAYRSNESILAVNPLLAAITVITTSLIPSTTLGLCSPILWLNASMILITMLVSFRVFIGLERHNAYLTSNLQGEVERQTENIQAVLNERDNLLRYVTHDLKKPVMSMQTFLKTLREREKDAEQIKTIDIVSMKTNELYGDLTNLGRFAKQNYVAENSTEIEVDTLLHEAFDNLEPDCSANGIILKYTPVSVRLYGKKNALESVLHNLILNAIEHSDCNTIMLGAFKKGNYCHITVSDDGKGIPAGQDVFRPYYSDNEESDNLGLGLYLCKSFISSMGGDLTYTQGDGKLTFIITLPLA